MLEKLDARYPKIKTTLETSLKTNDFTQADLALVETHIDDLIRVLKSSRFVQESICHTPKNLIHVLANLPEPFSLNHYHQLVSPQTPGTYYAQDSELESHLRQKRTLAMLRIIYRDVLGLANLNDTTNELSFLAQACLWQAHTHHYNQLVRQYGEPKNDKGQTQAFLILGMGKLGAHELNLSSDIDLIFTYPESGTSVGGKKAVDNQVFFTRLGQKIIQCLDRVTADGHVFRVDMRLRPYGQSGALVSSFAALENYYQTQGREWERYAMIKARVVLNSLADDTVNTGQPKLSAPPNDEDISRHPATQELMSLLRPFIYRRYIDYSVVDALRKLKQSIRQEVRRRGLENDVKLSSGGIREVEFIAQTFQLIRGGRDKSLQTNKLFKALDELESLECLTKDTVKKLKNAYSFLRRSEHAIQAYKDRQSQKLPDDSDAQNALLAYMAYESWNDFINTLNTHRHHVDHEFHAVISDANENNEILDDTANEKDDGASVLATKKPDQIYQELWQHCLHKPSPHSLGSEGSNNLEEPNNLSQKGSASTTLKDAFEALGFETSDSLVKTIEGFSQRIQCQVLQETGRERIDEFMPRLFKTITEEASEGSGSRDKQNESAFKSHTLLRILPLVQSVSRRSAYLLLLSENPEALKQLVKLSAASPWIPEQLKQQPALLDELLDSRTLYHLPSKASLTDELHRALLRVEEDDLEEQMNVLRHFRSSHALRVAACEISGALPLTKVSDYLSFLAESILTCCLQLVWKSMTRKHGYPDDDIREHPKFTIIGYGKLGGIELSHGSDLDLIFLYEANDNGETRTESAETNATHTQRSINNQLFYTRLGQKLIHMLNTRMASGRLYEVDMRLRPSGNSGQLCTQIKGFKKYQQENAWTWEHQALVRARPVAGDAVLAQEFNDVRKEILGKQRKIETLKKDVSDMREKMRKHLSSENGEKNTKLEKKAEVFHLKQDAGGIVDIEFMVQYAVLAWSHELPDLMRHTDNIRILECLAHTARLPTQEVEQLTKAYKAYRSAGHRRILQQESNLVESSRFDKEREHVVSIWQKLFAG